MSTATLTPREKIDAARAERDEALAHVEDADRDGWDRKVIDQAIEAFAEAGKPFSANDIRDLLPEVREALIGSRFMSASVRRYIRKVGRVPSTKKNTHAKEVAVWVIANRPSGDQS
jgi:hypothetical protein